MMSDHVRNDLRGKIGEALVALRRSEADDYPQLWWYTPYERSSMVPDHELGVVVGRLQAEVKLRRQMGDAQYFGMLTPEEKEAMYVRALMALRRQMEADGRRMDAGITHAEYRVRLNRAMLTLELPVEPVDLCLLDAPPTPTSGTTAPTTQGTTKCTTQSRKSGTTKRGTKAVNSPRKTVKFQKPTVDELSAYFQERKSALDPAAFFDYYEANGWKVGKNPMVNWKNAVNNWIRKDGVFVRQSGNVRVEGPAARPTGRDFLAETTDFVPKNIPHGDESA